MSDDVELIVGQKRVKGFKSYSVESRLFSAASAFNMELRDASVDLSKDVTCQLRVNGEIELMGIIDRVERNSVSGRDFMGLVVDAYVEEFKTLENKSLKALAEELLANVDFINRKNIKYGKGDRLKDVSTTPGDDVFKSIQLQPGSTVFDVLRDHARTKGMLFFSMPDGTFIFGTPKTSGAAEFHIVRRLNGRGNNIKDGWKSVNRAAEYSSVTVLGQKNEDDCNSADCNVSVTVTNPDFPYRKPFVTTSEMGGDDLKKYANMLLSKQRFEGLGLSYLLPGHSQNGRNWQVNTIVSVLDEHPEVKVKGDFLVYSRTFRRSSGESSGTETSLRLSRLGELPV